MVKLEVSADTKEEMATIIDLLYHIPAVKVYKCKTPEKKNGKYFKGYLHSYIVCKKSG